MLKKSFLYLFAILFSFPIIACEAHKKYDVVAIGEAMVDIVVSISEDELKQLELKGLKKSDTTRINSKITNEILTKYKDYKIIPGGSEANVIANFASLGGKAGFNSIVANDKFGKLFKDSLIKEKVDYLSKINTNSKNKTALCFTFITPDKERTFAVSGDITSEINDSYVDFDAIKDAKIFYTDASDLDNGQNKSKVSAKAFKVAKENSTKIAFNLNNNFFINKNRDEIINLLPQMNILMGGEAEAKNLFDANTVEEVISKSLKYVDIVVITQGKKSAIIATKREKIHIPTAAEDSKIKDLNGAGDAFVAGFLFGQTQGLDLEQSGNIAAKTAAEIIYQVGGRTNYSLANIAPSTQSLARN